MVTNNGCDEPTAASGKVLQGQGVGTASNFSTATYPATATGTGTILRADGTNWVATTATYPDTAGTSGNVLTSDGTNWSSSTPASSTFMQGYLHVRATNPVDLTTYYFAESNFFTTLTSIASQLTSTYIPVAFTLNKVVAVFTMTGNGTNENGTLFIRVNNSSNTTISAAVQLTSATVTVTNSAIGLALSAGDFITFGFTGPTWSTNPTGVALTLAWSS